MLHRQNVSLAALQDMKVGQVIDIPRQAAETIQLTIAQPGGRTALIATGRLGGFQDNKVVKLETAVDRRLILHVGRALRPAPEGEAEPQPAGPEPEAAQAVI